MDDDFIKQVLSILGKNLHIKENSNFIDTLFEERAERFHIAITKDNKYKIDSKKIRKLQDEIFEKYDNADDIIKSMEEYEDASGNMGRLIEKQMYKHGVYDGMRLIVDGLQKNWKYRNVKSKGAIYLVLILLILWM